MQMSMDCVRELAAEEDDHNTWTLHNFSRSVLGTLKSPFRHTHGIRNMGYPTKGPLATVREAEAATTVQADVL